MAELGLSNIQLHDLTQRSFTITEAKIASELERLKLEQLEKVRLEAIEAERIRQFNEAERIRVEQFNEAERIRVEQLEKEELQRQQNKQLQIQKAHEEIVRQYREQIERTSGQPISLPDFGQTPYNLAYDLLTDYKNNNPDYNVSPSDELHMLNKRAIEIWFQFQADSAIRNGSRPDLSWVNTYPQYFDYAKEGLQRWPSLLVNAVNDARPDGLTLSGNIMLSAIIFAAGAGLGSLLGPVIIPLSLASTGYAISESDDKLKTSALIVGKSVVGAAVLSTIVDVDSLEQHVEDTTLEKIHGFNSQHYTEASRLGLPTEYMFDSVYAGIQPTLSTPSLVVESTIPSFITGEYIYPTSISGLDDFFTVDGKYIYPTSISGSDDFFTDDHVPTVSFFEYVQSSLLAQTYNRFIFFLKAEIFSFLKPSNVMSQKNITKNFMKASNIPKIGQDFLQTRSLSLKDRATSSISGGYGMNDEIKVMVNEMNYLGNIMMFVSVLVVVFLMFFLKRRL